MSAWHFPLHKLKKIPNHLARKDQNLTDIRLLGMKGVRFSERTYIMPITMKASTTATFSITIRSLKSELPFVPRIRMSESTVTSTMAGRLMRPPSA